jgi:predicted nuclease of predicted toxin-antitoxin system
MHFVLDENVPMAVAEVLLGSGHTAEFLRDRHIPPGSPDPLVATVAQELDAILISFDGDFEKIAPRVPRGQRARFRKLSRIWLRCNEPQAAARLKAALDLVVAEYGLATPNTPMRIWISASYIRTDR